MKALIFDLTSPFPMLNSDILEASRQLQNLFQRELDLNEKLSENLGYSINA